MIVIVKTVKTQTILLWMDVMRAFVYIKIFPFMNASTISGSRILCLVLFAVSLHTSLAKPTALTSTYQMLKPMYGATKPMKINRRTPVNMLPTMMNFPKKKNGDDGTLTFRSPLAEEIYARNTPIQINPIISEKEEMINFDAWNSENDTVVLTYEVEYDLLYSKDVKSLKQLESHFTYIVLKANRNEDPEDLTIYYWVGQYSHRTDSGNAAAHAIRLDSNVHTKVKLKREVEGQESDDFKALFEQDEVEKVSVRKEKKILREDSKNIDKRIRMFSTDGMMNPSFKEVAPLLRNVPEVDQCMVFVSKKVHVFCALNASEKKQLIAQRLAEIIRQKRGMNERDVIFHRGDKSLWEIKQDERQELTKLVNEIESIPAEIAEKPIMDNPDEFTPSEMRHILGQTTITDDGEEIFPVEMIRFYTNRNDKKVRDEQTSALRLPLEILDPRDSYLIDTCSNLGLIVWIGKKSAANVRMQCARRAEKQFLEKYYKYMTPITFVDPEDIPQEIDNVQQMIHFLEATKLQHLKTLQPTDRPATNFKLRDDMFVTDRIKRMEDNRFGNLRPTINFKLKDDAFISETQDNRVENLRPEYADGFVFENEQEMKEALMGNSTPENNEYESRDVEEARNEPSNTSNSEGAVQLSEYLRHITGKSARSPRKPKPEADEPTPKIVQQVAVNSVENSKSEDKMEKVEEKPVIYLNSENDDISVLEMVEKTVKKFPTNVKVKDNVSTAKPIKKSKNNKPGRNRNPEVDISESIPVKGISDQSIKNLIPEYDISKVAKQITEEPDKNSRLEYTESIPEPTRKTRKQKSLKNVNLEDNFSKSETVRKPENESIKNLKPNDTSRPGEKEQPIRDKPNNSVGLTFEDNASIPAPVKKPRKKKLVKNLNTGDNVSEAAQLPTNQSTQNSISEQDMSEDGEQAIEEPIANLEVVNNKSPSKAFKQTTKRSTTNSKLKNTGVSVPEVVQPTIDEPAVRRRGRPRKNKLDEV